MINEIK